MSVRRPRIPNKVSVEVSGEVETDLVTEEVFSDRVIKLEELSKEQKNVTSLLDEKKLREKNVQLVSKKNSFVKKKFSKPEPKTFSGKGIVLFFAVLVFFVMVFAPIREYVSQRKIVAQARVELEEENSQLQSLANELDKWDDPDYVKQYIRKNLFYVMPGEIVYVTSDLPSGSLPKKVDTKSDSAGLGVGSVWYESLWDSIGLRED